MTFDIIERPLGKETLWAERINTTGVPVYSAWSDRVIFAVYSKSMSFHFVLFYVYHLCLHLSFFKIYFIFLVAHGNKPPNSGWGWGWGWSVLAGRRPARLFTVLYFSVKSSGSSTFGFNLGMIQIQIQYLF